MTATVLHGNNLDVLPTIADCSIDSIVTDPPYELGFMGKKWDASGIAYNVDLWRECLRVLKPGGHLLAFGGTRTYHRMAVAIEDAGFEIRDSIHWIYGSGFPKSLDVSKAIDKAAGVERRVIGVGKSGTTAIWSADGGMGNFDITAPATDAARTWEGWGTALKPAHEPIVLARKPLVGTVAHNVLTYGTGALNIDGCRVGQDVMNKTASNGTVISANRAMSGPNYGRSVVGTTSGRWPANVIHDGHPDVVDRFPRAKGGAYPAVRGDAVSTTFASGQPTEGGARQMGDDGSAARFFAATPYTGLDGESFIYVPKPSRTERNAGLDGLPKQVKPYGNRDHVPLEGDKPGSVNDKFTTEPSQNFHPTVKPLTLMRYLIRLVTPPGGIVLEPFAGSGTTLAAATLEGMHSIGIELTEEYLPIIHARVEWAEQQAKENPPSLF
jgi:site-specific DNA-methyltransferase (adenine-specific)